MTIATRLIAVLLSIIVGVPAVAADFIPGGGIVGSPHDFTSATSAAYLPDQYASVCIFCHVEPKPSWGPDVTFRVMQWSSNHRLSDQNFFWSTGTETLGGTRLPTNLNAWMGPSARCLSCHDGTVSIGDVRLGSFPATSFVGGTSYADRSGNVPHWMSNPTSTGRGPSAAVESRGRLIANSFLVGATGDLNGTHPVGIPYPYGHVRGTYNGIHTGDAVDLRYFEPFPRTVKLFTAGIQRIMPGEKVGATGMECATCHDVHNEQVRGPHLLRDTIAQICSDCHRL